jgi:phenylacetate-CoA ligase
MSRATPPSEPAEDAGAARLLHRAYGSARIAAQIPGQRRAPFLPVGRLRELRDRRVRDTVRYAAASVPYYRRLFLDLGIDPHGIRTADDLDRLPLLDKAQVRENPEDFLSTARRASPSVSLRTSGSTGEPLTVRHDIASVLDNVAYSEREREVIRRALGGKARFRSMALGYRGSTGDEVRALLHRHALIPHISTREKASPEDRIEEILGGIDRFRPDVVVGNGAFLEAVFREVAHRGARIHLPRVVIYHGQAMGDPGREFFERELGIPVYSRYNAVEAFKIGFTCEERQAFHLNSDLTHVRIVDADGKPCAAGQTGEVIISNLVNRATVLLNYRLHDVAALSDELCACGRTLPLLSDLEGRLEEILPLAEGRFLGPRAIWRIFKTEPDVLQYQLVQERIERYLLRLRTTDQAAFERVVPPALGRLRELLGPGSEVVASRHARLEGLEPGKFRPVMSRVLPGGLTGTKPE